MAKHESYFGHLAPNPKGRDKSKSDTGTCTTHDVPQNRRRGRGPNFRLVAYVDTNVFSIRSNTQIMLDMPWVRHKLSLRSVILEDFVAILIKTAEEVVQHGPPGGEWVPTRK